MNSNSYLLVRPEADLALRGIRVLIAGPERQTGGASANADIAMRVEGFLAYTQSAGVDIRRQVLALDGNGRIAGMCLWVPSPGRTAMLFIPSAAEHPQSAAPTGAAVARAMEDARHAGIVLLQAMQEPADAAGKTVFAQAGMTQLATLTYMERKPPPSPMPASAVDWPPDFELLPYDAATHPLFRQAIAESYEQTLDCPALSEMRDMEDVIAGHKAVGPFDPQLWSVVVHRVAGGMAEGGRGQTDEGQAMAKGGHGGEGEAGGGHGGGHGGGRGGDKVAGCLLLSEIPARRGLEVVYLGLAPFARGRGLGRLLMQRVLAISSRRHFDVATLAVDAANTPALKLYRRCGYSSVAQRVALIKRLF